VKPRILVVDDHPVFRYGLVALVESDGQYEVVGEAGNLAEAMAFLERGEPDLVLVDLSLGDEGNGIDVLLRLRDRYPKVRALVVSIHSEAVYAKRLRQAGAQGFVHKRASGPVLREAIRTVLAGRQAFGLPGLGRVDSPAPDPSLVLSPRERQVLGLIGKGLGVNEVAATLGLSAKTVGVHQEHIKARLGVASSYDLRRLAIEWEACR